MSFHQDAITSSHSSSSAQCSLSCIVGSALEALIHEILYMRSIYPRDAFAATRYLGITCHACRHPQVVQYIHDALLVAVPALISGFCDELLLVFYDTDELTVDDFSRDHRVLQKFVFSFDVEAILQAHLLFQQDEQSFNNTKINAESESLNNIAQRIQDLQRSMRDVLLKVISTMDDTARNFFTDTTTFKICLHRSNHRDKTQSKITCDHLQQAMDKGAWMMSTSYYDTEDKQPTTLIRPIRSIHVPSCGFKMQLAMEST